MQPVQLKAHQQLAIDKLENGKILYGGVGTGKTITSLVYYFTKVCGGVTGDFGSMRIPKDLYIITTAKKRDSLDWEEDALKLGIGWETESNPEGVKMVVDSWNNIHKYLDVKDAFFIFDEQRVVGSGKWAKNFIKIAKKNQWILLSATPGDTWMDYIPVFIANGFYKNITEFKLEHVVYNTYSKFPKVDRYTSVNKLVKLRNHILVEMPYERHTNRVITTVPVTYDVDLFEDSVKKRWNPFEMAPMKDVSELFRVMRKIVNSDPSRLKAVQELTKKHDRLIVFYNFNYELDELRKLGGRWTTDIGNGEKFISSGLTVAEWNGHKHEEVPTGDRWVYLVQYTAGSEGWNCVTTDAMCFYSLTYSYKAWHQSFGRIDRLNTPYSTLYYYVLMSKSVMDKMIKGSLNEKKNFNESTAKLSQDDQIEIDYIKESAGKLLKASA